jgi:DNA-binding CsgD family transcriptional regulator
VLDQDFLPLFSNQKARSLCREISKQFPPYKKPNDSGILIPEEVIENCMGLAHLLANPADIPVPPGSNRSFSLGQGRMVICRTQISDPDEFRGALFTITLEELPRADRNSWKQALGLTDREAEVSAGILRGQTNAEIARVLFISEGTVKNHLKHIFQKVGVKNRTALAHNLRLKP